MSAPAHPTKRRWPTILLVLLIVIPIIEVYLIIQVGHAIGGWQTFWLIIVWSLIGAWIVKREWSKAFGALSGALRTGRMPARELADAAIVLVGGVLLLAPGFLTDLIGLLLILPFTRPFTRRLFQASIARRVVGGPGVVRTGGGGAAGAGYGAGAAGPAAGGQTRSQSADDVIEGEIVDD